MTWHKHLTLTDHKTNAVLEFIIYAQFVEGRPLALYCVVDHLGIEMPQRFNFPTEAITFLERKYAKPADVAGQRDARSKD